MRRTTARAGGAHLECVDRQGSQPASAGSSLPPALAGGVRALGGEPARFSAASRLGFSLSSATISRCARAGLFVGVSLVAMVWVATAAGPQRRHLVDRVAAKVNDEIITENELLMVGLSDPTAVAGPALRATLDALIEERLLAQAARNEIKEVPEERIANAVEAEIKARRALFPTEQAFVDALEDRGWDLESYKENLRCQTERRYLVRLALARRVRITDEDVAAHEQALRREGKSLIQYRLSQIFLALAPDAPKSEVAKAEQRMLGLLEDVRRGVSFERLVSEHSEDPNARATGGDLGWMEEKAVQPGILQAVRSLEVGGVSQPVRTTKGLHLFRLEDKRSPRELLFQKRLDETRKQWAAELRRQGDVKVLLPHLQE